MTAALAFAIGALVANGVFDVVYKYAAQAGVAPHTLVMTQGWCFTVFVFSYGLATGTLDWSHGGWWGAVAGVFLFTGLYNFARSLQSGAVSVNAPVFRMNFLVTALLAVLLLGESLGVAHIGGLLLAPVAAWLLLGGGGRGAISSASLARVLVATLAMGIANLVYKVGTAAGATPAGLLSAQAAVFVTLATVRVRLVTGTVRPGRTAMAYGAAAALMLIVGLMLLLAALARGPASRLVPIAQMGFAVSAAVGIVFLGEQAAPRRIAGLAIALAALGGLAWGGL
jgi:drug/metabolite transporter (DMT)-like permease